VESTGAIKAKPSTPPPSDPPRTASFQQTLWTFNTGSFADTFDLRRNVDPILRTEVGDNLRIDHPDVFDTLFGQILRLDEMTTAVLQSCRGAEPPLFQEDTGWADWPEGCEETAVLRFLRHYIGWFLLFADEHSFCPSKRRCYIIPPNKPIPESVSKRELDIGLAYNSSHELEESDRHSYDWSHIFTPGGLKSNPREDNHSSAWLDLEICSRDIQRTRYSAVRSGLHPMWFNHAIMGIRPAWGIGSTPIDIKDAHMFVSVVLGSL
jgi:hypothetical protein